MKNDLAVIKKLRTYADDLRGVNRLTIAGIAGIVELVEAMHHRISIIPRIGARSERERTTGITRLVYRSVRGVTDLAGYGIDVLLASLAPAVGERSTWPGREAMLAGLNGVLGDYLAASANPLAITMCLRRGGVALPGERRSLAAAIPQAGGKVVVLVHGLCRNDLQWTRKQHDHGAALARDLGYTPVYLHYNSGLHVSVNGRAFARQLETLVRLWPVPVTELVLIGHSMGGLVARSACHYGALAHNGWLRRLEKLVFLGTPHHGAPLERGGNWVDALLTASRYSAPFARLGRIRSAGITDLRFGNVVDEDWNRHDRFARTGDRRVAVPLPQRVACYAIAGMTSKTPRNADGKWIGDGIVPLSSALGRHANPRLALGFDECRQQVFRGTNHFDLLSRQEVYEQIRRWLAVPAKNARADASA